MIRKTWAVGSGAIVLVAVAIQLLLVRPAFAQLSPGPNAEEVRKLTRVHFGNLFLRPTVTLDNFGVDTNVFNSSTNPQSDFTGTLSPRLESWTLFGRRAVFSADARAGLVYYKTFSTERSLDPGIHAQAQYEFAHLTVFGVGGYLSTHQRSNYEIDGRVRHLGKEVGVGASLMFSPKLSLDFTARTTRSEYAKEEVAFGTNLSQSLDSGDRVLSVALLDRLTTKTTFVLRAETHRSRFDTATAKNGDTVRITPGLELSPRALISGAADVGLAFFTPVNAAVRSYSGLVAKVALSSTVFDGTRLGVTWDRDLSYSFESTTPYYLIKGVGGSVRRQLIRDADVILSAQRTAYDYQSLIGVTTADRQDVTTTWSIDLGYRVNRDMRVGFAVSKWQRTSTTVTARDYSGLRAGVTVTYVQSQ